MTGYCPAGFPHSDIPGSKPACGSPRLFAACHVLLRLSAPRHPPCTLSSLTNLELHTYTRRILSLLTRFSCQGTWISGIRASCAPWHRNRASQMLRATRFHAALVSTKNSCLPFHRRALLCGRLVELIGFEPTTSALQGRRSPN
jgi:hypothetical protein